MKRVVRAAGLLCYPALVFNAGVCGVSLYVHRNRRLISDGSPDGHLDFHTPPELSVRIETELFLLPVLTENVAGPVACPRMLRTRFVYYYG